MNLFSNTRRRDLCLAWDDKALNRKLRIYITIFEEFFLEISVPFDFHPGISGVFGLIIALRKLNNFRIFWNFLNFWSNGKSVNPRQFTRDPDPR